MNKIKEWYWKFRDLLSSPSHNRTLVILWVVILAIVIPVTVVFLGQRTNTQQSARLLCNDSGSTSETGCGQTGGCTNSYSSKTTVFYDYTATCSKIDCISKGQIKGKCGATTSGTGNTCGVNSDCISGDYCDRTGKCRVKCTQSLAYNQCYGDHYTCTFAYNANGICGATDNNYQNSCTHKNGSCGYTAPAPDPNKCESPNHTYKNAAGQTKTTANGMCEKYECGNNQISIGGTCATGDSTCCLSASEYGTTPKYTCLNPGDPSATAFSGTDGSVTYCQGKLCTGGPVSTSGGVKDATAKLCTATFDPNSCTCNSADSSHRGFSCGNGLNRSCGTGLICSNANKGAQSGLWPCITDPATVCKTFGLDFPGDNNFNDAACASQAKTKMPKCEYDSQYKLVANGNYQCVWNAPSTYGNPSCSDGKTTGTCYTNNSCGNGMHEISDIKTDKYLTCGANTPPSSGQSWRICCAPGAASTDYCQYAASGDGGYCGSVLGHGANTDHLYTCANKTTTKDEACSNGCQVNSSGSDTCKSDGGGGGGGNPTPTPIPCKNGQSTSMALNLKLEGIGAGDFENNNPISTRSAIYIKLTDQNNTSISVPNNTSTVFNYSHGTFNSPTINLGTSLSCGHTYTVTVKIPRYLPVKGTVEYAKSNVIALNPIVGDINKVRLSDKVITGDDQVSVLDYSLVRACRNVDPTTPQTFTDNSTTVSLTCAQLMNFFDYADGGTQGDEWAFNYNLWARGYFKANGF